MNKKKVKIPLLFILLLLVISTSGCLKNSHKYVVNITIRVTDGQTGLGISGANVIGADRSGTTNSSGEIKIINVEGNKKYSFVVRAQGYNEQRFELDVKTQNVEYGVQLYKITGNITGTVVDDNDNPVEGASIVAEKTSFGGKSGVDGSFYIELPVSNTAYTIIVSKDNHAQRKISNVFVTEEKRSNDLGKIILSNQPGKISGTITDEKGNPIKDVNVYVKEEDKQVSTNNYGTYTMEILPGNYTLVFSNPYYMDKEIPNVEVQSNKTTTINTKLEAKPGYITGTIRDNKDKAISDVIVEVLGTSFASATDATGYFRINNVPAGDYILQFSNNYFKTKTVNVTVKNAQETNVNKIYLDPKTGSVYGVVVDKESKATVSGAIIKSLTTGDSTTSMTNGSFQLNNIRIGVHRLSITATDYSTTEIEVTVDEDGINNIGDVYLFRHPSSIYGQVRDKTSLKYIENVSVMLIENPSLMVYTDGNGIFRINNLYAGIYTLKFEHPDYTPKTLENVGVEPNAPTYVGIIDITPKPGMIQGITTPGANINLRGTNYKTTANDTGSFILSNIPPGEYTVDISLTNYNSKAVAINLGPNELKDLGDQTLIPIPGKISGLTNADQVTILENNISVSVVNGTFTFNSLMPGTYTLKYTKEGYREQLKIIDVAPNENVNAGTVTLEPITGTITGYITCTNGNITLVERKETQYYNIPAYFTFENLKPGTYHLTLQKPNYQSTFYTVSVGPGQTVNLGSLNVGEYKPNTNSGKTVTVYATLRYSIDYGYRQPIISAYEDGAYGNPTLTVNINCPQKCGYIWLNYGTSGNNFKNQDLVYDGQVYNLPGRHLWQGAFRCGYNPEHECSVKLEYNCDTGAPNINISKTWGYGPTSVTVSGEDTYSGVQSVQYSISSSPTSAGAYQTISNGGTVTINSKGIWYLHVKLTDNVGHVSTRVEGPYIIP